MNDKLKIWHFSDSHTFHEMLTIPDDIDIAIFSGDCSNPRDPYKNEHEVKIFLEWFSKIKAKHKIMIAGNHDSSIEKRLITKDEIASKGIIYLENESIIIEGYKIWGSPYVPQYGNWCFMRTENKLNKIWETIPQDSDIIIVHGPAKGILDKAYDRKHELESCGNKNLLNNIFRVNPKLFCFGHIHDGDGIINAGTMKISNLYTIFSNGSCCVDGKFGKIMNPGNVIFLDKIINNNEK